MPLDPGLWRHKCRPVLFYLIVDEFGLEYVRKHHTNHLLNALKEKYEVTVNKKATYMVELTSLWTMSSALAALIWTI